ncbi:MAG: hypothetical protein GY742_22265, partial [Hyphomicrobiales bacterium]|nr:hypothetical protein [Hyphomicrobiales bacterium]
MRISKTALELALWLTDASEDGLPSSVEFSDLQAAFKAIDKKGLQEACYELECLELVTLSAALGHPVLGASPTYNLFWTFDLIVVHTNPIVDAVKIAQMIVDDESLASIPKLHIKLEWSKRRLNPAVAQLMPLIADGRTRKVVQNDYPTLGFSIAPEDRF